LQKVAPGFDERVCAVGLQLFGQNVQVDPGLREFTERCGAVPAIAPQHIRCLAVIRHRLQRSPRHRVHGVGCSEPIDIKRIRRVRIFGSRAREQQTLRARAEIGQALPTVAIHLIAIGLVGHLPDGKAQSVLQGLRNGFGDGDVPA
jgi:hypothetical protein